MRISYFFKGSWIAQLIVGICLFLCSFYLEYQILRAFISPHLMAFCLALTLETGKVTAIVWHYYLDFLSSHTYPGSVRMISLFFRCGLLTLSLLCSQLFLTSHLDRPHLQTIRAAKIRTLDQETRTTLTRMKSEYESRKESLMNNQQQEISSLRTQHDQSIRKLEQYLVREMDNVVNGEFKGLRYREFEKRLAAEKLAFTASLENIRQRHFREHQRLSGDFESIRNSALEQAEKKKTLIEEDDFSLNEQVNDKHIVSFLKVIEAIFHHTMQPLQFVFLFSILLSILMEAGIILAFSTITVSMAPVLLAQHQETMESETLCVRMEGETKRSERRHHAALDRIVQAGERTVRKAREYAAG